jgi:hypothetical protein
MTLRAFLSLSHPPARPNISLPRGIPPRTPLPDDLVEAIAAALDRESLEPDLLARARLLAGTRSAIKAWLDGVASTPQTVRALNSLPGASAQK